MQGKFVFVLALVVIFAFLETSEACKICGNPWCNSEDSHDHHHVELSIVETPVKPHHHHHSSHSDVCHVCGAPKCHHKEPECCPVCGGLKSKISPKHDKCGHGSRKLECKCKTKKSHHHDW